MDDSDDMRDSDDDLNITQSVRKDLGHEDYIKSMPPFPIRIWLRTDVLSP